MDDKITVGFVHSSIAMTGFVGAVGDSLCVTGVDNGCARGVYKTVGGLVRYRLKAPYAIEGGLVVSSTQPFLADLKLGGGARWRFKKYAVEVTPNLLVAITQRSSGSDLTAPHSQRLNVPATGTWYPEAPPPGPSGHPAVVLDDGSVLFGAGTRFYPAAWQ